MAGAAFFDLDGTLLTVNSAALWVRRERRLGRVGKRQAARAVLYFAAYRLGALDIDAAMKAAASTIAGVREQDLRTQTRIWWDEEVARHAARGASAVLQRHRDAGEKLVLLTSSSRYASECAKAQFALDEILCTEFEVAAGRLTGGLARICYGPEKVAAAAGWAEANGVSLAESAFYTDSYTDLPMLLAVGRPHVVGPDARLRWEARRRRWPVHDWVRPPAP